MPFVTTPEQVRIHYRVHEPQVPSARCPVVLIQGLGLSGRFWFEMPDAIARDAERSRRVIVVDNRGTGGSDKPIGLYRTWQMAEDLVWVLEDCGIERAIVVGISLGGMIAMQAAIRHPRRVAGLVLLATTPGLPLARLPTLHGLAALLCVPFVRGKRVRWVDRILLPEHALDRAQEIFRDWPQAFRLDPITTSTFVSHLGAAALHSAGFSLKRIQCPTVVVAGEEDILIPPVNARRIAKRIPNARLEVLPAVGHAIPALDRGVILRALGLLEAQAVC